jgi:hypothetical protein
MNSDPIVVYKLGTSDTSDTSDDDGSQPERDKKVETKGPKFDQTRNRPITSRVDSKVISKS